MPVSKMYSDITPEKWLKIIAAAKPYGIWIDEAQGQTETFGVKLKWNWQESARRLDVTILQAGIVGEADVLGYIDNIIQSAK